MNLISFFSGDGLRGTDSGAPRGRGELEPSASGGRPGGGHSRHGGAGSAEEPAHLSGTSVCALL